MVCGFEENEIEEENFSPVPDFSVIKIIITIAKQKDWIATHFDVEIAFQTEH